MQMFPMVAVCLVFLGLGLVPQTVYGVPFNALGVYEVNENTESSTLYKAILDKRINLLGRSGLIDLPPNFFDVTCREGQEFCFPDHSRTDLCFIVQVSCTISLKELKNVVKDIKKIISDVGDQGIYRIVTYSKTANDYNKQWTPVETLPWPGKKDKIKLKNHCDRCQAQLPSALDWCKDQFKELNTDDPTRELVPDVIVSYTDGLSFRSKFDETYENEVNQKLVEVQKCNNTAGRAFKLGDSAYHSDEWAKLEFTNTGGIGIFEIPVDPLKIDPKATKIPAIEGLDNKTGDPFSCPHCCNADIVVVIDRSNSIEEDDLTNVLDFFYEYIEAQQHILYPTLNLSRYAPGLRFAFLTYNCPVTIHCDLGTENKTGLLQCIASIPHTTGTYTNTKGALEKAKEQLDKFGRKLPDVREVIIIATDGRTWNCGANKVADPAATIAVADEIKADGVEIYVFGLPNHQGLIDGCEREWLPMASEPKACHIIDLTNATYAKRDLARAGLHLTKETCTQAEDHFCTYNATCANLKN